MNPAVKAAIVGGIFLLISPFVWQILTLPDPIWQANIQTGKVCQTNLNFRDGLAPFRFTVENLGKDKGTFEGTLRSSDVLLIHVNTDQEFTSKNSKAWTINVDDPITYEFTLKLLDNGEPENITVEPSIQCYKPITDSFRIPCGSPNLTCQYQNQHSELSGSSYKLIN